MFVAQLNLIKKCPINCVAYVYSPWASSCTNEQKTTLRVNL